jgi:hypothetical protein
MSNNIELLSLLNIFQHYTTPTIYQDYYNAFNRISSPWYFPSNILSAISNTLRVKKVIIDIDDPDSWKDLFDDLCTRFKTVRTALNSNTGLSSRIKSALEHTENYCKFVHQALEEDRSELFQFLARWGINCLESLSSMIDDNLLIKGGGPTGLITAYFLHKSIPNLKIVLVEKRKKYTRNYQIMLNEDTFDTLPYEIKQSFWGYGTHGCYVLPPPIDAKGYCFINPPGNLEVPNHYYSSTYPNEYFNVNSLTGRRTFKKLMTIPIGVFENAMEELIRIKYPEIKIIRPTEDNDEYTIHETPDSEARGLNKYCVKNKSGKIVSQNLFSNDAMYNYIVDASGAQSISTEGTEGTEGTDVALTLIVKSNFDHIRKHMTEKNVDLQSPQDNTRFFSNNEKWHTALFSIRNLPHKADFYDKHTGEIKWADISDENRTYINKEYKKYTGKDIVPNEIERIDLINLELKNRHAMFGKDSSNGVYTFYVGDSACNVHFFSGTGINNGIRMATKLTEMLTRIYRSRWKRNPDEDFTEWGQEMDTMCETTLEKSKKIMGLK